MKFLKDLNDLPPNSKVCLYGAGRTGLFIKDNITKHRKDVEIVCFIDDFKEGKNDGLKIVDAELLKKLDYDLIIVTAFLYEKMEKKLMSLAISNYMIVDSLLMQKLNPSIIKEDDKHRLYLNKGRDLCNYIKRMIRTMQYGIRFRGLPIYIHPEAEISQKCEIIFQEAGGFVKIGYKSKIEDYAYIYNSGAEVEIGHDCFIGLFNLINAGCKSLKIGNYVIIAAHTALIATNHGFERRDVPIRFQEGTCKGIIIEDDVWIGAGCKILDGVVIGRGSVIGAGSVVTKSIPEFSVVAGVPAQVIYTRR